MHRHSLRRGFTMIEMAIVLAIVAITAAVAVSSGTEIIPRWKTRQGAREFQATVAQARHQAMQLRRQTRVVLTNFELPVGSEPDYHAMAWRIDVGDDPVRSTVWTYLDGTSTNHSHGSADPLRGATMTLFTGAQLTGASWCSDCADSIVFNPDGTVANQDGDLADRGAITVNFVNKAKAIQGETDEWRVRIFRSGMARIETSAQESDSDRQGGVAASSSLAP